MPFRRVRQSLERLHLKRNGGYDVTTGEKVEDKKRYTGERDHFLPPLTVRHGFNLSLPFSVALSRENCPVEYLRDRIWMKVEHRKAALAQWARIIKNPVVSTGPLPRPFTLSLAPLTRLLAPPCLLCSRAPLRSLVCSNHSLICLIYTTRFALAFRCAPLFTRSPTQTLSSLWESG